MEVYLFIRLACGGLRQCGHAHKAAAPAASVPAPQRKVDSRRVSSLTVTLLTPPWPMAKGFLSSFSLLVAPEYTLLHYVFTITGTRSRGNMWMAA